MAIRGRRCWRISRKPLRLYASSTGLEPRRLVPGQDLVASVDPVHGLDLPAGVLLDDHLDLNDRLEIDSTALSALVRWRESNDEPLTVDGLCLPWLWELELYADVFLPVVRLAAGLGRALAAYGQPPVELCGANDELRTVATALGNVIPGAPLPAPAPEASRATRSREAALVRRLRRSLLGAAELAGFPSSLRPGAVVLLGYWHVVPLVDRLLTTRAARPAVALDAPIPGAWRSLAAARRGGWIGFPGPRQLRRGRRLAEQVLPHSSAPTIAQFRSGVAAAIQQRIMRLGAARAARDLARWDLFRTAFGRPGLKSVVVPFDVTADARLVVGAAQAAGVRSIVVSHGAYVQAMAVNDFQVADIIALWSAASLPAVAARTEDVRITGYPGPRAAAVPPLEDRDEVIAVLAQGPLRMTSLIDGRMLLLHYETAIRAAFEASPKARVILRPHPSHDPAIAESLRSRFPDADLSVDAESEILDLMARTKVCIGTYSTATFQAALAGAAVVALNLTGREWGWPLGGDTPVPVARTGAELTRWLESLRGHRGAPPGRDELLDALGATTPSASVIDALVSLVTDAET